MLPLYLLACHMVGDFLFQNRWHSERKFVNARERAWHVLWYTLAFVPVVIFTADSLTFALAFIAGLASWHFLTDSRRYLSTPADVLAWRFRREFRDRHFACPPNPWSAMPLMIDQTLHVVQIAILGGLFLS